MEYLTVVLFFYLSVFVPFVFECRVPGYALLTLLLYLLRKREKLSIVVLYMILLFSLFSSSLASTAPLIPIGEDGVAGLYGRVVTEPGRKNGRYAGFSILLESVMNERGDYFSSSGKIYVIGPDLSLTIGDIVFVEGAMREDYFLSTSGFVVRESTSGTARRKVNAAFIRSLPSGEVGNITSLLLTGTTLDGDDTLQTNVRALGLSHLISLSGMHLGFITAMTMPLLTLFLSKKKAKRVNNAVLIIFVYLAGLRPSLVRSLIFVVLIPVFGIGDSFILSLVLLLSAFPQYVDEVATVLSFTSLSGILLTASCSDFLKEKGLRIFSSIMVSVAAVAASAPVVYSVFGSWQPYSFVFSLPGLPVITLLFILTIIRYIIPKSDLIIKLLLDIINNSSVLGNYLPPSESFLLYYPFLGFFLISSLILYLLQRRRR